MTWTDILVKLVEVVFYGLISIVIPLLFSLVKKYNKNVQVEKLIDKAEVIVTKCVAMVNQTFVDYLKKEDSFDDEEKRQAFELAKANILEMMSEEAKLAIIEQIGDLDVWLKVQIEAAVAEAKKPLPIK